MTIKEFYESLDESYEEIFKRFQSDERIRKYVGFFLKDESFNELEKTLDGKDYETAFRMAHTLKGVAANLGFNHLHNVASDLTELLRAKQTTGLEAPFEAVKNEYQKIVNAINNL